MFELGVKILLNFGSWGDITVACFTVINEN